MIYAKDYRGLHATVDIQAFEEILTIPFAMTISCENLEKETELGKKLAKEQVFDSKWKRFIFPLIYVMDEMNRPHSRHRNWLEIIPKQATDHPMFFTAEETKWLCGSSIQGT